MLAIPATIDKVETKVDRTLKLTIGTQELSSSDMADVMRLHGKLGYFVFGEKDALRVPEEPLPEFSDDKSPSKRLRGVLYKTWELNTDKSIPFDQYYRGKMEAILDELKEHLN